MTLPNYFFADLPPDAELTPAMLTESCRTLRRNREQYLADRPTHSIIETIRAVAEEWRRPDYHLRKLALEEGPARTGFPRATLEGGLEAFFSELTAEKLEALVIQDLG